MEDFADECEYLGTYVPNNIKIRSGKKMNMEIKSLQEEEKYFGFAFLLAAIGFAVVFVSAGYLLACMTVLP